MLYRLLDIGVSRIEDEQEREIYRVVNGSAFTFLPFILVFIAITYTYFPELVLLPIFAFISYVLALILNHFNYHTFARCLFVLTTPIVMTPWHLGFINENEPFITSLLFLQLIFTLHAWVIFRLDEKRYLIPITLIQLSLIAVYGFADGYNHFSYSSEVIRTGWVQAVVLTTDVSVILFCIILLKLLNFNAVKKVRNLLSTVEVSNQALQENSDKLEGYLKELKAAQLADQKRQWVAEGLNRLHALTRTETVSSGVYDKLLAETIHYLSANQGALYIRKTEQDETYLDMTAAYAYNRKKYLEKRIEIGQGLVGQCYLERDYIHLTEIPQNYLKITSGLGEALPRHLMIFPLIHNEEQVEGILEMASFHPFEEQHIEFLKQLSSLLASYLFNQKINQNASLLKKDLQEQEDWQAEKEKQQQQIRELEDELSRYKSLVRQDTSA